MQDPDFYPSGSAMLSPSFFSYGIVANRGHTVHTFKHPREKHENNQQTISLKQIIPKVRIILQKFLAFFLSYSDVLPASYCS